jgi:hypothetical protein
MGGDGKWWRHETKKKKIKNTKRTTMKKRKKLKLGSFFKNRYNNKNLIISRVPSYRRNFNWRMNAHVIL